MSNLADRQFPESGEADQGGATFQNEADDDEYVCRPTMICARLTFAQPLCLRTCINYSCNHNIQACDVDRACTHDMRDIIHLYF